MDTLTREASCSQAHPGAMSHGCQSLRGLQLSNPGGSEKARHLLSRLGRDAGDMTFVQCLPPLWATQERADISAAT